MKTYENRKSEYRSLFTVRFLFIAAVAVLGALCLLTFRAIAETQVPPQEPNTGKPDKVREAKELLQSKEPGDISTGIKIVATEELRQFKKALATIATEHDKKDIRRLAILALLRLEDTDLEAKNKKQLTADRAKITDAFKSENLDLRKDVLEYTRDNGLKEFTQNILRAALQDKESAIRTRAIEVLAHLAEDDVHPFLPGIEARLAEERSIGGAQRLMGEMTKYAKANEDKVMEQLRSGTPQEKMAALNLVKTGELSECLPLVRQLLRDKDAEVSFCAFCLLEDWKGTGDEFEANCAAFGECLQRGSGVVKKMAANALAQKKRDKGAVDVLVELVKSEDFRMRDSARASLEVVTGKRMGVFYKGQTDWRGISDKWEKWWKENRSVFK